MRTVGLTFHEETQSAPAVEAGFAAAHGIDVTGAAKKQDLLLAVQTAVEPSAAPAEAVPGEQPEMVAE